MAGPDKHQQGRSSAQDSDQATNTPSRTDRAAIDIETYQTELQLQYEELKHTQHELLEAKENLEKLNEHFGILYHHAPHGYVTLDHNGVILQANETFADKINLAISHIVNRKFVTWISASYQNRFRTRFVSLYHNPEGQIIELELRSRNANPVFVALKARRVSSPYIQSNFKTGKPVLLVSVHDITVQKSREDDIRRLAYYDDVTNLPNRRLFMEKLDTAVKYCKRHHGMYGVFFLDLDRFKAVNDNMGHMIGDLLLREVAERIQRHLRSGDTVARLAGDEFVILLPDVGHEVSDSIANCEKVAHKIAADISQPYFFQGRMVNVSSSIGITLFPMSVENPEEIIKQADHAMYEAKKAGHGVIRFFHQDMQRKAHDLMLKENGIKSAIRGHEFFMLYQPKVDKHNNMVSVEALARWERPGHGVVMPDDFIEIAEQADLIYDIWLRTLNIVCEQSSRWKHKIRIAVNVSPKTFRNAYFIDDVRSIFARHEIPANTINFELTENVVVDHIDEVIIKMRKLIELGITFSLDDFGTGYSSLQYLQLLPISELKIDRHFVAEIGHNKVNDAIVDAILTLGQNLELDVVAEGIETRDQLEFLDQRGCNQFQGFYFATPLNPGELIQNYLS